MAKIVERVRRCPHCQRESDVPSDEWRENPYCNQCLKDRLVPSQGLEQKEWLPIGNNWGILIPKL
jgi:hypothetical protein